MARKREVDDLDACGAAYRPSGNGERKAANAKRTRRGHRIHLDGAYDADGSVDLPADAVRIRVRKDEIIITIRTDALRAVTTSASERIESEPPRLPSRRGARAPARAPTPAVGFATVPADKFGQGYGNFTLRKDLADSYRSAYAHVKALGGTLTSSGAMRSLREPATPGRSKTSLHYTGRAIDLFIYTGMQGAADPYMVTRAGGTDANPEWKLYCVSSQPLTNDPLYRPELVQEGELECAVWKKGVGYSTVRRRATYFCLTDLLAIHGWHPIPARKDWKTNYLSCEWWHFQNHQGLVSGESRFGDELRMVWPVDLVRASGLMLDAVWAGRSFRASARAAPLRVARKLPARARTRQAVERVPKRPAKRHPRRTAGSRKKART